MIRALIAGALAAAATLGGLAIGSATDAPTAPPMLATEFVQVPTIVAPMFAEGRVSNYALVQIGLEVDARTLAKSTVPPAALLADAVHDFILTGGVVIGPNGPEPDTLRETLRLAADEALGGGAVRTFVMRLNILPKEDVRGGSRAQRMAEGSSS